MSFRTRFRAWAGRARRRFASALTLACGTGALTGPLQLSNAADIGIESKAQNHDSNNYPGQGMRSSATAVMKQGRLDEAVDHYKQALRISPKLFRAYVGLGLICINRAESDEAVECFEKALGG